jgi:hypothetical protein
VDTSAPIDVELIFSGELLMGCREGGEIFFGIDATASTGGM